MLKIIKWAIKIGGSLFPEKAIKLIESLKGQSCLIVTGGGDFANLIRKYDDKIHFSKEITHETAIDSMDIIVKLLNDKFNFTEIVYSIEDACDVNNNGKIPILACSEILRENKNIPKSWNLTSDSISAYAANLLKAKLLIATNVDGIYTREPTTAGSKFINEIDAKKLLTFNETSVDLMIAELLLEFGTDCFVVNGNFPERVLSLIRDSYTHNKFNSKNNKNNQLNNNYTKLSYEDSYDIDNYAFKYTIIRGK